MASNTSFVEQEFRTPPQVAEQLGVNVDRVRGWIRSGQLAAINVADSTNRPRWRISGEAFADFCERRSSRPAPTIARRRIRKPSPKKEYF